MQTVKPPTLAQLLVGALIALVACSSKNSEKWTSLEDNGDKPSIETIVIRNDNKLDIQMRLFSYDEYDKPTAKTEVPVKVILATSHSVHFSIPASFVGEKADQEYRLEIAPVETFRGHTFESDLIDLAFGTKSRLVFSRK